MECPPLDPYEQQLLTVFDSYDFESRGSLDRDGLTQLCCTLQLEEQGAELVQRLLADPKHPRVTFTEFKDALLMLLGNVQNGRSQTNDALACRDGDKGSPDREVSPKFVYGSKKYGRRSRPRHDDASVLEELNENMNYSNKITYNTAVQRSNSQGDVLYSKKRKTNTKLKRCTSFPGNHDYDNQKITGDVFVTNGFNSDQEFICTEEMLRKAWEKLGVGEDGYLNQTELILVCDAIGLHRLAEGVIRQLSNKLELDADRKISFQELLEALQQDDAWSDVLNPTSPTDNSLNLSLNCLSDSVFPDLKTIQYVTLGPDGTGLINTDMVVEMWENAGITSPKALLHELGFAGSQISVAELATTLEKEIKESEIKSEYVNPHIVLLQAVLTLYKSEIRCLKNMLEQMHAEREKLKGDVLEANNRATMLAQEVDDNHARMEQSAQRHVRLLEQRHADALREAARQFAAEKEQMVHTHRSLEQQIRCLEAEEARLRSDLLLAQEYSSAVDKENQVLAAKVADVSSCSEALAERIQRLENERQNYELESQQAQVEPLLQRLSALQIENSQLRDRNDEMLAEIESLNGQISAMRVKGSPATGFLGEDGVSIVCEGVGLGSKRRNDDSPSKDLNVLGLGDGSPRLGKVRKCHKTKPDTLELPVTSSESGFDTELDALDSSLSISVNDNEEIIQLQAKVAHLEEILKKHSIPVPPSNFNCSSGSENATNEMKIKQLTKRCADLQSVIGAVQCDLNTMLSRSELCGCESTNFAKILNQKLSIAMHDTENCAADKTPELAKSSVDASTETDGPSSNLELQIEKYVQENQDLSAKCSELENCIELLKTEYERCEDYWASKLDEERQMFEQEQNQSSEKLTELIGKMAEYEAQFAAQDEPDYRLPPIEEKYQLEKQFTDLEQEFEEYKEQTEFQMAEKINEIADLKERLGELEQRTTAEVGVQTCELTSEFDLQSSLEAKMSNLTNCVIESTNLFSADTMPFKWSGMQDVPEQNSLDTSASSDAPSQRDYVNPAFAWDKNSKAPSSNGGQTQEVQMNIPWQDSAPSQTQQPFSIISIPSTSADSVANTTDNNATPSRPKRSRKHEKNFKVQRQNKKEEYKKDNNNHSNNEHSLPFRWKGLNGQRLNNGEQMISLPIGTLHNLNGRLHHLEQRCRHLQVVLKQQHYHAEQMLQHCWQQYRGEKAELQYLLKSSQEKLEHQMRVCNEQLERLARTDMLVKDLYVENSYLVANVQRLEKQCHMLTQFNSASSSV